MQAMEARVRAIAEDRDHGASELLACMLPLLAEAIVLGEGTVVAVAREIRGGQPAMAPLWNACGAALADFRRPGRFAQVRQQFERAPRALIRAAAHALREALAGDVAPRILTVSYSASVGRTLAALTRDFSLTVVCAEGRPRLEGRRLAGDLAQAGARVAVTTDAAIATFVRDASAVVVGADSLAATQWINKVGTFGLAAAADRWGVPVFVVGGRDKAWSHVLGNWWSRETDTAGEVWGNPPADIAVVSRLFEAIPADLATLVLTDIGPIAPGDLPGLAEQFADDVSALIQVITP
jgi:ribose 1,5-bisphosphate isomerase